MTIGKPSAPTRPGRICRLHRNTSTTCPISTIFSSTQRLIPNCKPPGPPGFLLTPAYYLSRLLRLPNKSSPKYSVYEERRSTIHRHHHPYDSRSVQRYRLTELTRFPAPAERKTNNLRERIKNGLSRRDLASGYMDKLRRKDNKGCLSRISAGFERRHFSPVEKCTLGSAQFRKQVSPHKSD